MLGLKRFKIRTYTKVSYWYFNYLVLQLRVVAVKLKKRLTETQQQLESDRQKWALEKNDLANKANMLTASARNNQVKIKPTVFKLTIQLIEKELCCIRA